jgi:hypothetical protein
MICQWCKHPANTALIVFSSAKTGAHYKKLKLVAIMMVFSHTVDLRYQLTQLFH